MGTSTIMDIITSAVIAGVLLLIALRLNAQANESTMIYNGSVILQENVTTLVAWLEHDFRQIGFCGGGQGYKKVPIPSQAFRYAGTSDITFWTDLNGDGKLDSVRWHVGTKNDVLVNSTPNPNDVPIYRDTNGVQSRGWSLGVTQFALTYFDYDHRVLTAPVASPDRIYEIQIMLTCQSPYIFQEGYRNVKTGDTSDFQVIWRQIRLAARNIKYR